jgi:hypothetical protein
VGPSEIGGCRRKVWEKLQGTPVTNPDTLQMAANMGTAWHTWIESRLAGDPRFLLEVKRERDGIRGTADCFDLERRMVVDWKTIKLSGVPYFPSKQQRWQVQVYGWLLSLEFEVESVCLVGFPRDGTDLDVVTHVEPYEESVALEALGWLEEVRVRVDPPKPETRSLGAVRGFLGLGDGRVSWPLRGVLRGGEKSLRILPNLLDGLRGRGATLWVLAGRGVRPGGEKNGNNIRARRNNQGERTALR